jgi:hypothetical protein
VTARQPLSPGHAAVRVYLYYREQGFAAEDARFFADCYLACATHR